MIQSVPAEILYFAVLWTLKGGRTIGKSNLMQSTEPCTKIISEQLSLQPLHSMSSAAGCLPQISQVPIMGICRVLVGIVNMVLVRSLVFGYLDL